MPALALRRPALPRPLLDIAWCCAWPGDAGDPLCLVVHALESFVFVTGFELYLAGVVVIELGSAGVQRPHAVPALARRARAVRRDDASNLGTLPFVFRWFAREPTPPLLARITGALSVPGMLGSRQLVALKVGGRPRRDRRTARASVCLREFFSHFNTYLTGARRSSDAWARPSAPARGGGERAFFGAAFLTTFLTTFLATGLGGAASARPSWRRAWRRLGRRALRRRAAAGFGGADVPAARIRGGPELPDGGAGLGHAGPGTGRRPSTTRVATRVRPAPRSGIRPIVGVATRSTGTRWTPDGGATRKDGKQRRSEIIDMLRRWWRR